MKKEENTLSDAEKSVQVIIQDKKDRESKASEEVKKICEQYKVNLIPVVQIVGETIKADIIFSAY